MSTTTTYTGVRIADMPDLGAFTGTSSLVGERAGSGRFSAAGLSGFFLPLTGGTVNGPVTLSCTNPAIENYGFFVNQTVSGTNTSFAAWATINITDTVNAAGSTGGGAIGTYMAHLIDAGATGGRTATHSYLLQRGVTTTRPDDYYVSAGAFAEARAPAGGSPGAPLGNLFGRNTVARLVTGAGVNWFHVCGDEIDVSLQSGTTAQWKTGLSIIQLADDAVRGPSSDAGLLFVNQSTGTAPGWSTGIQFGGTMGWWPFRSDSTIIGTAASSIAGGPAMAADWGIDFSAITFGGGPFRGPGFAVDRFGAVTTLGIHGTTTNDNAVPGLVGEWVTAQSTAAGITTGTNFNATSISLTAGDWDVEGTLWLQPAGTTVIQTLSTGINTTSATFPAGIYTSWSGSTNAGSPLSQPVARVRLSLATTTTVYLVGVGGFTVSTCSAIGYLGARRVR